MHLQLAGLGLIVLALAHFTFPRRFHWTEELARLGTLNRQMFRVHVFFMAAVLVLFGTLSLLLADELLVPSPLARALLGGFTLFWALRLYVQLFVYERALWRGDRFNTAVHILFTSFWTYLVAVYGTALARQLR